MLRRLLAAIFFISLIMIAKIAMAQLSALDIVINGQRVALAQLVLRHGHHIFVSRQSALHWGFDVSKLPTQIYQKRYYVNLQKINGVRYRRDQQHMQLLITAKPQAFTSNDWSLAAMSLPRMLARQSGFFINYDIQASHAPRLATLAGVFSLGVFNQLGHGHSNFLARKQVGVADWLRLDSVFEIDHRRNQQVIAWGDVLTDPGLWDQSLGIGGVQWRSDFAMTPNFLSFPLPSAQGAARVPSLVDIYIDNALVASKQVPVGPFDIDAIPAPSGRGAIRVVTTDLLGRQQQVAIPYVVSDQLLKPGLHHFSLSAGFIRNNYGLSSFDYGRAILTATDMVGITSQWTRQIHGLIMHHQVALGETWLWLQPQWGLLTLAVGGNMQHGYGGGLLMARYTRQSRYYSISLASQWQSPHFRQAGSLLTQPNLMFRHELYLGKSLPAQALNLGGSIIAQQSRSGTMTRLLSLNMGSQIDRDRYFSITALTNLGGARNRALFATLTLNLATDRSGAVSASWQDDQWTTGVQVSKAIPDGIGYGYNLTARNGDETDLSADGVWQTAQGDYEVNLAREDHNNYYQLNTRGSLIGMQSGLYRSRPIQDSFAVIQLPGYQHIGIYENNHLVAHTDRNGEAVLPDLAAYENNTVRLNINDLPVDALVGRVTIPVVPYYRSGVLVKFNIKPAKAAIAHVKLASGQVLPVSAQVRLNDQTDALPVGYQGLIYLTDLHEHNSLHIKVGHSKCTIRFAYQATQAPFIDLGTLRCHVS